MLSLFASLRVHATARAHNWLVITNDARLHIQEGKGTQDLRSLTTAMCAANSGDTYFGDLTGDSVIAAIAYARSL
eukprot:COSAG02_NODE_2458_length_8805_cov_33.067884_3_plen_75_part_00